MINVYVIGVFDLFHPGHVELLKRSKALGDRLIVAINGDEMVAKYKRRPFLNEEERLKVVEACRYVDHAFIIRDFDNKQAVIDHKISKIVHGDDWEPSSYLRQICLDEDFLKRHNVELVFLPYTKGISTGSLINKIKES